jgi:hypothetical protein
MEAELLVTGAGSTEGPITSYLPGSGEPLMQPVGRQDIGSR